MGSIGVDSETCLKMKESTVSTRKVGMAWINSNPF